jgi:hypothetical protein
MEDRVAKFWVEPAVSLAESYKMKPHELSELQKVVEKNKTKIKRAWYEYFGK